MIGPFKLFTSCAALLLAAALLVALSASPVEAGPDGGPLPGENALATMPAPHEWVMVVLLFALVIAFHHCRQTDHHRA